MQCNNVYIHMQPKSKAPAQSGSSAAASTVRQPICKLTDKPYEPNSTPKSLNPHFVGIGTQFRSNPRCTKSASSTVSLLHFDTFLLPCQFLCCPAACFHWQDTAACIAGLQHLLHLLQPLQPLLLLHQALLLRLHLQLRLLLLMPLAQIPTLQQHPTWQLATA